MNRTERMYAIAEDLRAAGGRGRTAAFLAERFEVSVRTIKRDMRALLVAGTQIRAQDGRGGGYQLERAASLPPLAFTAGEATAIAVAIAAEPSLPFRADARTALAKLMRAMTPAAREHASDVAARIWMRTARSVSNARPRVARIVDEALAQRRVLALEYVDGAGAITRRRVDPLALARTHGHWHLLAWCHERRAGRWFRLDRIRGARITREAVVERDLRAVFGAPPEDAQPVRL